jgi:MATE family multidrug resistance protein
MQVATPRHERRANLLALLRIAVPLALAELGWMAMGVVDTIMVGHLPESAVSIGAVSVGNALFYGFTTFGLGLMAGLDTLVSQAFGANDLTRARRALASGLGLAACALPVLAGAILVSTPVLRLLGVRAAVLEQATPYIRITVAGLPPLLLYSVCRRYLQALHHVRPIVFALITANLVNVFGDWLLIFGRWGFPALGVSGSAISTVIARVYLAGVLFAAVKLRDSAAFSYVHQLFRGAAGLLRLGLPAALAVGFEIGIFNFATALAGSLDPGSLAAHSIALNADAVAWMVPLGISSATAVSVGKAVGAGDRAGARTAGWTAIALGGGFGLFTALCCLVFPRQIAGLYTSDRGTIELAVRLFRVAAVFQAFDGTQTISTGALRGLGNTRTPMLWNLLGYWIIGLPVGWWLCFRQGWGIVGLWDGLCVAILLISFALLRSFNSQSIYLTLLHSYFMIYED